MQLLKFSLLTKIKESESLFIGILVFLYSLLPFSISNHFVFPNQIQVVVMLSYFAVFISFYLLYKLIFRLQINETQLSKIDIFVFMFALYFLIRNLFCYQDIEIESVFQSFSVFVLYLIFRNIGNTAVFYILLVFPFVGIAQIFYGIKNQANNFAPGYDLSDIIGIFNNSGIFGGFISIVFVITFGLFFYKPHAAVIKYVRLLTVLKLFSGLVLFLFLVQLISTNSRASWLAAIVGVSFFICSYYGLFRSMSELTIIRKWIFIAISSIVLGGLIVGFYNLKKDSADGRILIWRVSAEMIKDKPLFGHGLNGFQAKYMDYQAEYLKEHPNSSFGYLADNNQFAFNEFVRIWVEQGVVGLISYLLLLYMLFFYKTKFENNLNVSVLRSAFITFITFGLFSYPMAIYQFKIMSVLFIALLSSSVINEKNCYSYHFSGLYRIKQGWVLFTPVVVFFVCAYFLFQFTSVIRKYDLATKKWNSALISFNNYDTVSSITSFKSVYPLLKNNGIFLSTYGKALYRLYKYQEAIPILQRANKQLSSATNYIELGECYQSNGEYANAEKAWIKASFMIPAAFTPHYNLAKMYIQIGKITEAKQVANYLLRKEVKIRSPELYEMLIEMDSLVNSNQ